MEPRLNGPITASGLFSPLPTARGVGGRKTSVRPEVSRSLLAATLSFLLPWVCLRFGVCAEVSSVALRKPKGRHTVRTERVPAGGGEAALLSGDDVILRCYLLASPLPPVARNLSPTTRELVEENLCSCFTCVRASPASHCESQEFKARCWTLES